jgi:hypothetical protein
MAIEKRSVETSIELTRVNRELEDLLDRKDAILNEKEKQILSLTEALKRSQYEKETIKNVETGRFAHTKILLLSLEELKKDNENLQVEIQSLQFARDTLFRKSQREEDEKLTVLEELRSQLRQNHQIQVELDESKIKLAQCEECMEELQRELSLCQHLLLDERARVENQAISINALKMQAKNLERNNSLLRQTSRNSLLISNLTTDLSKQDQYSHQQPTAQTVEHATLVCCDSESESENDGVDWKSVSSITEKASIFSQSSETVEKVRVNLSGETVPKIDLPIASRAIKRNRSSTDCEKLEKHSSILSKVLSAILLMIFLRLLAYFL